ncbi:adult-specific cuticular protein ACP-20-like [Musca vetustissima]|uniref:adult-specific cuticular protein ACP-20-like n=1 Tax=Musca vetustissima TaxID=27455 RepID=UPI002AB74728|nr:adult-specific cuticular protein ACP-20-like [Musca vetustissima]
MKFLSIGSLLALSGLAAAGNLHHGGASSYSTVVEHGHSYGHGGSGHGIESGHGWSGHGIASYGHGGAGEASSYASVVKHDDSHGHGVESGHGWSGHGYASYGHGGSGYSHGGADHDYGHDYHSYPQYEFSYGVKDSNTGDMKDQWEHRDGDHVKGSYTVKEADGTTRVVDYHADGHHGFHAVVKKLGHAHHPETYHHHGDYAGHGYGHATSYAKVKVH